MSEHEFNKTQLSPEREYRLHRDYLAHVLRWTHVVKYIKKDKTRILDVGCGDGNLPLTLYKNRYGGYIDRYVGLDINRASLKKASLMADGFNFKCEFYEDNLITLDNKAALSLIKKLKKNDGFDLIVCFEVLEHMDKPAGQKFLRYLFSFMEKKTILLLSTPNYDQKHKADNHIHEWCYDELHDELVKVGFKVDKSFGTFASQKDYEEKLRIKRPEVFDCYERLKEYYDSNFLAIVFAPLFPKLSRNVLWRLKCY